MTHDENFISFQTSSLCVVVLSINHECPLPEVTVDEIWEEKSLTALEKVPSLLL